MFNNDKYSVLLLLIEFLPLINSPTHKYYRLLVFGIIQNIHCTIIICILYYGYSFLLNKQLPISRNYFQVVNTYSLIR